MCNFSAWLTTGGATANSYKIRRIHKPYQKKLGANSYPCYLLFKNTQWLVGWWSGILESLLKESHSVVLAGGHLIHAIL